MKVIVTGPTGRAGQEVVKKCLEDERITKVVILTRRGLPGEIESHPKADVIMHQDFTQYSDYLIRRMQGSEACIWYVERMNSGDHILSQSCDIRGIIYNITNNPSPILGQLAPVKSRRKLISSLNAVLGLIFLLLQRRFCVRNSLIRRPGESSFVSFTAARSIRRRARKP